MLTKKYHVIIPHGMQPLPESFELSAADILAGFSRYIRQVVLIEKTGKVVVIK
jgi:hypothetical protein